MSTARILFEKGRAEGRAEGQRALLIKQLALKFGPLNENSLALIHKAEPDTLCRWGERLLWVGTLDELFSPN